MNLGPCLHETALPLGKIAADELDGIDRKDTDVILVVRMEVWSMMRRRRFGEHADDDPKEPGNLWHGSQRSSEEAALGLAMTHALSAVHLAQPRCGSHGVTLRLWLSSGQRADLDTRGFCTSWRVGAPGVRAQRRRGEGIPGPGCQGFRKDTAGQLARRTRA